MNNEYSNNAETQNSCCPSPSMEQHVHEVQGSTQIAERCDDPHNHRYATVSGEAMPYMGSHVHRVKFRTDSYEGHYHEFWGISDIAVMIGGGRHVHFIQDVTGPADQHTHKFRGTLLIDDPIED